MVFLEGDTNVLSFWVFPRVTIVSYVTRLCSKDAVVATEFAVLAGEPRRASLPENDVSWDDIFSYNNVSLAALTPYLNYQTYLHSSLLLTVYRVHLSLRWLALGLDALNVLRRRGPG
jgi:hypothetical protein